MSNKDEGGTDGETPNPYQTTSSGDFDPLRQDIVQIYVVKFADDVTARDNSL